jgi:hypothetical protein
MPMPKAAVDEDSELVFGEDNIRTAGKTLYVKTITVARGPKSPSNC